MIGAKTANACDWTTVTLKLLIVSSETADQQQARRKSSGAASHETYAVTLQKLAPSASIQNCSCIDGSDMPDLARIDGVLFAGSPIQMHKESAETRAAARFAAALFDAGVPAFGSCAGLQIAAVASGGTCRSRRHAMEAGFARGITATEAGRSHPMLQGRSIVWDAPAMHSSVVDALGPGGTVLARTRSTPVEAAEIRSGNGVFWGVQYHPELTISEIAASLRRQAEGLVEAGMSQDEQSVDDYAATLERLDAGGGPDIAWQVGIDDEITDDEKRTRELRNFLSWIAAS
jgi:GMP synthase (glutamine-hydrolysing)